MNSLITSEMRYRRLFETSRDGILLLNAMTAQIEDVNPYLIELLGYSHEEFLGKKLWEIGAFKDTELSKDAFIELQEKRYIRYDDLPLINKNGSVVIVEFISSVYKCDDMQVVQCNIRDNTDRYHAEEMLKKSLEQTIQVIAATIEERDPYTAGHQRRVANLCTTIAKQLGLSKDRIHGLHLAASIHDLGKISIPSEILTKPIVLNELEFGLIKQHPLTGFNILKDVNFPWDIARMIVEHHEYIDGSGYPYGLSGDELLLESKILTVADIVEAMASYRPYRINLGIQAALDEVTSQRGITLDAIVVDTCLHVFEQGYTL